VYEVQGKPSPSKSVLRMWWGMLAQYPIEAVEYGIQSAMAESKYLITPASVLEQLQVSDGRPDADEAWSIALKSMDEYATVVWNNEISEAYGIAYDIWADGDKVAARMAFKSAYDRIIDDNRRSGIQPNWTPTLGKDVAGREVALLEAREKGLLSHDRVNSLLPTPEKPMAENVAGLLTSDIEDQEESAKEHIKMLRDILSNKEAQ